MLWIAGSYLTEAGPHAVKGMVLLAAALFPWTELNPEKYMRIVGFGKRGGEGDKGP